MTIARLCIRPQRSGYCRCSRSPCPTQVAIVLSACLALPGLLYLLGRRWSGPRELLWVSEADEMRCYQLHVNTSRHYGRLNRVTKTSSCLELEDHTVPQLIGYHSDDQKRANRDFLQV
jgi:hypothetical protein